MDTGVILSDKERIFGLGIAAGEYLRIEAGVYIHQIALAATDDLVQKFVVTGSAKGFFEMFQSYRGRIASWFQHVKFFASAERAIDELE
jgi:hypothetical protein